MSKERRPLPTPSRLMLNLGIAAGGAIGFMIQAQRDADSVESFLITGGCAMLGAFIFSYIDVTRQR